MSQQIDNLDEVVEKITKKVVEKLSHLGLTADQLRNMRGPQGHLATASQKGAEHCEPDHADCGSCGHCVFKKPNTALAFANHGAVRLSSKLGISPGVDQKMASMIDHTLLKPEATREELIQLCDEAKKYSFATVCVNPTNIPLCARRDQRSRRLR